MGGKAESAGSRRYRVDRIIPGLGRVRIDTNARTGSQHRRALVLLDQIIREGRLSLVRALAEGSITWPELHEASQAGRLGEALQAIVLRRPFSKAWQACWPSDSHGPTQQRYRKAARKLERLLGPKATAFGLLRVDWSTLEPHYQSGADWNAMRRMVSRLLTLLVGKQTPQRYAIVERIPIWPETPRVPDVSLDQLAVFIEKAEPWLRPVILTLVGTGIRIGEYLDGAFDGVSIQCGTKTAASVRRVPVPASIRPYVTAAFADRRTDRQIRKAWTAAREAAGLPTLTRHDMRHLAAQLADEAGASLTAIQALLGHSHIRQTADYAKRRLRSDGADALASALAPVLKNL